MRISRGVLGKLDPVLYYVQQYGTNVAGWSPTPTCFPTRLENVETGLLCYYPMGSYIFTPTVTPTKFSSSYLSSLHLWLSEDCPLLDVLTFWGLPF